VLTEIPNGVSKCCSACHSRISRRLSPNTPAIEEGEGEGWPEEEIERLRRSVREHGTHWARVASYFNQDTPANCMQRTQHQCKAFFFSQRKKLALDLALQEYHKVRHLNSW
jgi:nuclear receptor co-repressor 1